MKKLTVLSLSMVVAAGALVGCAKKTKLRLLHQLLKLLQQQQQQQRLLQQQRQVSFLKNLKYNSYPPKMQRHLKQKLNRLKNCLEIN